MFYIVAKENIMPHIIIDIANILQPLHVFSNFCEKISTKLSEILPLISSVIQKLMQVYDNLVIEESKVI